MTLRLSTAEGFERIFDVKGYVGLPVIRTHEDVGNLFLTVTSRGSLGYLDDTPSWSVGMGLRGGPSAMFLGSLWAGSGPASYVQQRPHCRRRRPRRVADLATDPTGNVRVVGDDDGRAGLRHGLHRWRPPVAAGYLGDPAVAVLGGPRAR